MLWFDVGIKRYTTYRQMDYSSTELWFDVGIKRYTTNEPSPMSIKMLWFDVGIKRYTTISWQLKRFSSCGLM